MGLIILLNFIYTLIFPIGQIALDRYTTPLFLTSFRMLFGGALILVYQYFYDRKGFILPKKYVWTLFWGSFFCYYLTNALEFWALDYMSSTRFCFLANLYPFITALLSYIFLKEQLSKIQWLGLFIGFFGSLPVILLSPVRDSHYVSSYGIPLLPEIAVLLSSCFYAYGWIFLQKIMFVEKYSYNMTNGVTMIMAFFMAVTHSMFTDTWNPLPITGTWGFLTTATGLIIVSDVIYNRIYFKALNRYSLTLIAFSGFIGPIFTAIFDKILFNEQINAYFFVSFAIVSFGFYLFYKAELAHKV